MRHEQQLEISKSFRVKKCRHPFTDSLINAYRELQFVLTDDELSKDDIEDGIFEVKRISNSSKDVRVACKIDTDLYYPFQLKQSSTRGSSSYR